MRPAEYLYCHPASIEAPTAMLRAIGTDGFAGALLDLMKSEFGIVELTVLVLGDDVPRPACQATRLPGASGRVDAYCAGLYRGDPVFRALQAAPPGQIVSTCSRIADSRVAAYRSLFHFGGGLDEVVSLAFRERDLTILNLYRSRGVSLEPEALGRLNVLAPTLMSAVRAHCEAERRAHASTTTIPPLSMVEEMLHKVRPDLTVRETEVCARTVTGMTAYAISLDLGISVSTVTTYRRRAYARMGICSAYELLGSLISSSDFRVLEEFIPARAA